jgi:hypothetical protein
MNSRPDSFPLSGESSDIEIVEALVRKGGVGFAEAGEIDLGFELVSDVDDEEEGRGTCAIGAGDGLLASSRGDCICQSPAMGVGPFAPRQSMG